MNNATYTGAQEFCMRFLLDGIGAQQAAETAGTGPIPVVDALPGRRILVIAPHRDDEVISCGGLIRNATAVGARVEVLFCTSGSGGHAAETLEARSEARELRRKESHQSLRHLRVAEEHSLELPERKLAVALRQSSQLVELIERKGYDTLLAPGPTELHPDHKAVWRWVMASVASCTVKPAVYACEVWGSCDPSVLVRVGRANWAAKLEAMTFYQSQMSHFDYTKLIGQLSAAERRFPWLVAAGAGLEAFRLVEASR